MKPIVTVGALLIVLGLVALVYQRIPYTSRETIVDIGPVHATAERHRSLALPPVFGAVAVAAGIGLLLVSSRRGA